MTTQPPVLAIARPRKLPLFKTVAMAYASVFQNLGVLARCVAGWVVVVPATYLISLGLIAWLIDHDAAFAESYRNWSPGGRNWAVGALTTFTYLGALASVAVSWHRYIIVHDMPSGILPGKWARMFAYSWRIAIMALVFLLIAIIGSRLAIGLAPTERFGASIDPRAVLAAVVLLLLAAAMLFMRWSLVLPGAAAGGQRWTFTRSYELTRGNSWRLLWGMLLAQLLFPIFDRALTYASEPYGPTAHLVATALISVISLINMVVGVSFVSYTYLHFTAPPDA